MKTYTMKLLPEYFDYIKVGTKRLELRLNDEKRQNIEIDDIIIFEKLSEDKEYLKTKVKHIFKYNNFPDLVSNFPIDLMADKTITKEELLKSLKEIYPKEKQDKYGVLAIEIELI